MDEYEKEIQEKIKKEMEKVKNIKEKNEKFYVCIDELILICNDLSGRIVSIENEIEEIKREMENDKGR